MNKSSTTLAGERTQLTLDQFISKTHIAAGLVRAVVDQFGGWDSFTGSAEDVTNHGIDGGFGGFIYHSETEPFATANRAEIAELAENMASDLGEDGAVSLVRGFNCLMPECTEEEAARGLYAGENSTGGVNVLNALAWFAGEEVCRSYADMIERD